MEVGDCLRCGDSVHGHVQGILLTLYCEPCFYRGNLAEPLASKEMYWTWTSTSEAAYKKGINPKDLAALRFKAIKRNYEGLRPFSKKFLKAEVESLTALSQNRIQSEIEARRIERQEKRQVLTRVSGIDLSGLNAYIQLLLLGEYLSGVCLTSTEFQTVVDRCRVMPRVTRILDFCKDAHPEAAINFCLQYPDAGPEEFQELKEKMQDVFRLQGFRILGMLCYDTRRLIGTSLHDVRQQFIRRDRIACFCFYLEPMVGRVEAENIIRHPVCQEYFRWIDPEDYNDRYIVKQLLKFWSERGSPMEKRDRLISALESRGYMPPTGALMLNLCDDYINGKKFILMEEVVQQVLKSWMYQIQQDFKNGVWRR